MCHILFAFFLRSFRAHVAFLSFLTRNICNQEWYFVVYFIKYFSEEGTTIFQISNSVKMFVLFRFLTSNSRVLISSNFICIGLKKSRILRGNTINYKQMRETRGMRRADLYSNITAVSVMKWQKIDAQKTITFYLLYNLYSFTLTNYFLAGKTVHFYWFLEQFDIIYTVFARLSDVSLKEIWLRKI